MESMWIMVADASRAHLYAQDTGNHGLSVLREFSHPESRMKGIELASDRAGRLQGKDYGHSANEPNDPKKYEAERFAIELAQALEQGRASGLFKQFMLVAPPHFNGLLKQHLTEHTRALLNVDIEKDFTQLSQSDLVKRLGEFIRL